MYYFILLRWQMEGQHAICWPHIVQLALISVTWGQLEFGAKLLKCGCLGLPTSGQYADCNNCAILLFFSAALALPLFESASSMLACL